MNSVPARVTCLLCHLPIGACKTEGCKAMQPGPELHIWLIYGKDLSHAVKQRDIYSAIIAWNAATASKEIIAITRTDFTQPSLMCF